MVTIVNTCLRLENDPGRGFKKNTVDCKSDVLLTHPSTPNS